MTGPAAAYLAMAIVCATSVAVIVLLSIDIWRMDRQADQVWRDQQAALTRACRARQDSGVPSAHGSQHAGRARRHL